MSFVRRLVDLAACLRLLTGLPLPVADDGGGRPAAWAAPVVGAFLGGAAGLACIAASALGLGPALAALAAAAVLAAATGGRTDRALAAAAASLAPGGRPAADPLLPQMLMLGVRVGALAALADPVAAAGALMGAGALGYAALAVAARAAPDPGSEGPAAALGAPGAGQTLLAAGLGLAVSAVVLPQGWLAAAVLSGAAAGGVAFLASRRRPGGTGVLAGAAPASVEAAALLACAAG